MARILARSASGRTLNEIAVEEYVSVPEINRIVRKIKERLGAENLVQAALIAHREGFISLPDADGQVYAHSSLDRAEKVL